MLSSIFTRLFRRETKPQLSQYTAILPPPPPYAALIPELEKLLKLHTVDDYTHYAASVPLPHKKEKDSLQKSPFVVLSVPRTYLLSVRHKFQIDGISLDLSTFGYHETQYNFGDSSINRHATMRLYGFPSPTDGKLQVSFVIVFNGHNRIVKEYYLYLNPYDNPIIRLIHFLETVFPDKKFHLDLAKQTHNKKEDGPKVRYYDHELPIYIPIATFPDNGRASYEIARYVALHHISSYKVEDLHNHVISADTPEKIIVGYFESLFDSCFAGFSPINQIPEFYDNLHKIRDAIYVVKKPELETTMTRDEIDTRCNLLVTEKDRYELVCDVLLKFQRICHSLRYHFLKKLKEWVINSYTVAQLDIVPSHLKPTIHVRNVQIYVPFLQNSLAALFQIYEDFIIACRQFPEDTSIDLSHFVTDIKELLNEFTSLDTKN